MATLDRTGQYRRDLGWKRTRGGKRAQQRFYLGRDKIAAQVSETRLEAFWIALEGSFAVERKGASPVWEEWSLEIGAAIVDGKMAIAPPPPPVLVALFLNAAEPQTVCGIFLQHLSLYATSLFRRPFKNFSASCVEVQR